MGGKIPPGTSPSKVALFNKIDTAILQGLELVDYLEHAVEDYKANPNPNSDGRGPNGEKAARGVFRNRPSRREITEHVDVALGNAFALRDGIDQILREHSDVGSKSISS
jgi:hypothetical protein